MCLVSRCDYIKYVPKVIKVCVNKSSKIYNLYGYANFIKKKISKKLLTNHKIFSFRYQLFNVKGFLMYKIYTDPH